MAMTKVANQINVKLFTDALNAKLGNAIKLAPLAYIQNFGNEQGGTISVPKYEYIGDAVTVAEGVAIDPALLTQGTVDLTVGKVAKAVEITDEAVKSSYGDAVGQAEMQLVKSIASGIETKMFAALATATLVFDAKGTGKVDTANYFGAMALFGEDQDEAHYIIVTPADSAAIKAHINYVDGKFFEGEVIVSNRVPAKSAYIVKANAIGLYLAKDVEVETDRDILTKTTVISADEHFACHLRDQSRAVKLTLAV